MIPIEFRIRNIHLRYFGHIQHSFEDMVKADKANWKQRLQVGMSTADCKEEEERNRKTYGKSSFVKCLITTKNLELDENCFESDIWTLREDGDCNSFNPSLQMKDLMREAAPVFEFINAIGN
jgi:hypothetical protein